MKKFLTALPLRKKLGGPTAKWIVLSAFCLLLSAPAAYADTTTGLVGYWTFDGKDTNWNTNTTNDLSGNGNTGTLVSMATSTSHVVGKIGQALKFTGGIQYISTTNVVNIPKVTISTWVYLTSYPAASSLIAGFVNGNGNSTHDKELYIDASGKAFFYVFDGGGKITSTPTSPVPLNAWVHIVGTADGTNAYAYMNGIQVGSVAAGNTFTGYSVPNIFIDGSSNAYSYLAARIDDVRIYNRALSATDVMQLYKQGASKNAISPVQSNTSGLVGYWTFDGKDTNWNTNQTSDVSGSNSAGQLINMSTTTSPVLGKIGQALKFVTGAQQRVAISGTAVNTLTTRTFSAWIKPTSFGEANLGRIADKQHPPAGGCNCGWFFILDNVNTTAGMQIGQWFNNVATKIWVSDPNTITLNTWQFVAFTYDSSSSSNNPVLYVNGKVINTTPGGTGSGAPPDDSPNTLYIGNRPQDLIRNFDGAMDDVRLYNRVLSATEVTQLYKQGGAKLGVSPVRSNTSGLVGYWTFDGKDTNWTTNKTNDLSGQGNTGTLVNISTTTSPVMGKVGQALKFNGTSNYVNVPWSDGGYTASTPITFSAWAKSSIAGTAYGDYALVADVGTFASAGFSLGIDVVNGKWTWNVPDFSGFVMESPSAVVANTWYHLVGTFDGTTARFYINGTQVASRVPSSGSYTPLTNILRIGAQSKSIARYFNGSIDDLRVYNRALSATEVTQLYRQGTGKSR